MRLRLRHRAPADVDAATEILRRMADVWCGRIVPDVGEPTEHERACVAAWEEWIAAGAPEEGYHGIVRRHGLLK